MPADRSTSGEPDGRLSIGPDLALDVDRMGSYVIGNRLSNIRFATGRPPTAQTR